MSTPTTTGTTLAALATKANAAHAAATRSMSQALNHARECGEALLQVRKQVRHGEWGDWLRDNFQASHRTANGYMRIAERWAEIAPANSQRVANIGIREALAALSESREEPVNPWTSLPIVESMLADEKFQAGIRALAAARDQDPESFGFFLRDAFGDDADAFGALVAGCDGIQSGGELEVVAAAVVILLARLDPPVMIAA